MSEIVYLLGAGVNQVVTDWEGVKAPLANNFFQMALRSNKFATEDYLDRVSSLYDYISQHWKKSIDDLRNTPFNLEDFFTFLQLQINETEQAEDFERYSQLASIEFLMESFLAEYLSEFEKFASKSDIMREFGKVIYRDRERTSFLTFNYDCILESLIELASGVNVNSPQAFNRNPDKLVEIPDDELPHSHFNWNRPLAYGIQFNEVQLLRAGLSTYVEGNRFYSHPSNKLYPWRILKLHGSLNWFRYIPFRKYPSIDPNGDQLSKDKLEEVLLIQGHWWFVQPPDFKGWLIEPLIITPVLYKAQFYEHRVFSYVWKQAQKELSTCKRLIVIGYSFAPTDFYVRKLLLDAFNEHSLEHLVVVNPDTSVVQTVKEYCHFNRPALVCRDLEEYLRSYDG
jgi:hypothetical protein